MQQKNNFKTALKFATKEQFSKEHQNLQQKNNYFKRASEFAAKEHFQNRIRIRNIIPHTSKTCKCQVLIKPIAPWNTPSMSFQQTMTAPLHFYSIAFKPEASIAIEQYGPMHYRGIYNCCIEECTAVA